MLFQAPILDLPQHSIPHVTVFVHGTHRTVGMIPKNIEPIYKWVQHEEGFFKVNDSNKVPQEYCYRRMLETIANGCPERFPYEHSFIFCWSGELSHDARFKAAHNLHAHLLTLHEHYNNNYKLTVITHSHGGNVLLNLAALEVKKPYTIDALIIVAAPVQTITKEHIENPLFKTIYAPHSHWDMIQVLDPQGAYLTKNKFFKKLEKVFYQETKNDTVTDDTVTLDNKNSNHASSTPLFSQRHFPSSKVKHIEIISTSPIKRGISHIEFLFPPFTSQLGKIIEKADSHDYEKNGELCFNIVTD